MAILPADMESCDKKSRCLSGENEGIAYSDSSPCPSGHLFDSVTCNCISPCYGGASGTVTWNLSVNQYSWRSCNSVVCYQNCASDYWRVCASNTDPITFCADNVDCLVTKGVLTSPAVHCGQTAPCTHGSTVYLYDCANPDGTGCGIYPLTYWAPGQGCGECNQVLYASAEFTPNPKQRQYTYKDNKGNSRSITSITQPTISAPYSCGNASVDGYCYYDFTATRCNGTTFVTTYIAYGPLDSSPSFSLFSTGTESYCSCSQMAA